MNKIKAYLSHAIMGVKGSDATEEYIKSNNRKAIEMGETIRGCFPELDLHIPAEHEAFVHRAYTKGYLTIDQILDIDCDIINGVGLVLVYNHEGHCSRGMKREIDHAESKGIPIIVFKTLSCNTIHEVCKLFNLKE